MHNYIVYVHLSSGFTADWWSVGVILFELIVGIPPFNAEHPQVIILFETLSYRFHYSFISTHRYSSVLVYG